MKLFNTDKIHIEVSSKCTLKCPRCPRTELQPEQLNREYSLNQFQHAFPLQFLNKVNKIIFCGDIGDPIYATEFIEIIDYVKHCNTNVHIVTNGSYKKSKWWKKLGSLLNDNDIVQFSIDGWDNVSNNLYRINSDYNSIIEGIKSLKASSDCRIHWSSIYFNFNENNMDSIIHQAQELGVDLWQGVQSTKFDGRYLENGVDKLKPKKQQNVSNISIYGKDIVVTGRKRKIEITHTVDRHAWAKCLNWKKELFVNVEGLVFPCPWFNSGYQDNDFVQKYKNRINIRQRPMEEILNDKLWQELLVRFETMPLEICKIKCKNDR